MYKYNKYMYKYNKYKKKYLNLLYGGSQIVMIHMIHII